MAGYHAFQTGRVSFGDSRPKAPLVDVALVRPAVKASAAELGAEPQIQQQGFIPPKAVSLEDFEDLKALPMRRLVAIVAAVSGVASRDIVGQCRRPEFVKARQLLFWLGKNTTTLSLPAISYQVGKRHHTTCLHGVRRVQAVVNLLNIQVTRCPLEMAGKLWSLNWSNKV